MIRKDGHPFILDFGIAREIQETMTRVTGKLSSGTLLYMSPERLSTELFMSKIKQNIASKTDARFWIDNRYSVPSAFSNPSSQSAANSAIKGIMLKFYQMGLYSK